MKQLIASRSQMSTAQRIVVKIGSSSLTLPDGSLNLDCLTRLTKELSAARSRGQQVVLVSSGARAAGIAPLGLQGKFTETRLQQAAAMVGQSRLMAAYEGALSKDGIGVGQVLLTAGDVIDRRHYANAQEALNLLLDLGIIPIVNENDAVVTDELRFGDNDRLAALVSHIVAADALVILTDVDGLYTAPPERAGAKLISEVRGNEDLAGLDVTGRGSSLVGTGGMRTKIAAAQLATSGGVGVLLTSADYLSDALAGGGRGTWFVPTGVRTSARKLWLEHAAQVNGRIIVDPGAVAALERGASLLHVGVMGIKGHFRSGDLVEIADIYGNVVARGLAGYASDRVAMMENGDDVDRPVVHRNDLVRVDV